MIVSKRDDHAGITYQSSLEYSIRNSSVIRMPFEGSNELEVHTRILQHVGTTAGDAPAALGEPRQPATCNPRLHVAMCRRVTSASTWRCAHV